MFPDGILKPHTNSRVVGWSIFKCSPVMQRLRHGMRAAVTRPPEGTLGGEGAHSICMLNCSRKAYRLLKEVDICRLRFPLFRDEVPSLSTISWRFSQNLGTSCKETQPPTHDMNTDVKLSGGKEHSGHSLLIFSLG